MYWVGGIMITIIAFFMGATQRARGYSFLRYFLMSNVVLWTIFLMFKKAITGEI